MFKTWGVDYSLTLDHFKYVFCFGLGYAEKFCHTGLNLRAARGRHGKWSSLILWCGTVFRADLICNFLRF